MKVLLINPPDQYSRKGPKHYPLGLGYLATTLSRRGESCEVLDLASGKTLLVDKLRSYQPDVVGISVYSTTMPDVQKLLATLKQEFREHTIAGGPHATLFPEEMVREGFDFVVSHIDDPSTVRGITFNDNGAIVSTPKRESIQNLDELAFPDRQLFDVSVYEKNIVMGARGCSYGCRCLSALVYF